jgi:hypothetical protein
VRVGVLYNPDNVGRMVQEAQKAAAVVRLVIVERAISSAGRPAGAARAAGRRRHRRAVAPARPVLLGEEARRFVLQRDAQGGQARLRVLGGSGPEGALVSDGPTCHDRASRSASCCRGCLGEKGAVELAIPRAELVINKRSPTAQDRDPGRRAQGREPSVY